MTDADTEPEQDLEELVESTQPVPAIYNHSVSVYEAMSERGETTNQGKVYIGALSNLITQDLGLGNAYYSHVVKKLKAMGCIEMLQRGGGSSPSVWLLKREPTVEAYQTLLSKDRGTAAIQSGPVTRQEKTQLKQRQIDLERRIERLEKILRSQGFPV